MLGFVVIKTQRLDIFLDRRNRGFRHFRGGREVAEKSRRGFVDGFVGRLSAQRNRDEAFESTAEIERAFGMRINGMQMGEDRLTFFRHHCPTCSWRFPSSFQYLCPKCRSRRWRLLWRCLRPGVWNGGSYPPPESSSFSL